VRENRIKPQIRPVRSARYERTSNEGHGFSRAVNSEVDEGFSPWGTAFLTAYPCLRWILPSEISGPHTPSLSLWGKSLLPEGYGLQHVHTGNKTI